MNEHTNIGIKVTKKGSDITFNDERMNIFQRIRQFFCTHKWYRIKGQSGFFSSGKEYKSKHYRCRKCRLRLEKNTMVKDHWEEQ